MKTPPSSKLSDMLPSPKTVQDFDRQLTKLEASQAKLETGQAVMETEFRGLRSELQSALEWLKQIANRQQEKDRPNWMIGLTCFSIIITLFAGYWAINNLRIDQATVPLVKSLQEVETQFNAEAQMNNLQWSDQQRMNSILWNASPLGKITKYPDGPYYRPNISSSNPAQ